MHQASELLFILFILSAALLAATIFHKLKQPTLIGFIVGGIFIGPGVLALVPYSKVEILTEIGVGLLMFTIGLELSVQKLLRVRTVAILGGCIQTACIVMVVWLLGKSWGWSNAQSLTVGCIVALSSTAVVLRLLTDRGEIGSSHGNIITGTLLFQDIVAIPILMIIPLLASQKTMSWEFLLPLLLKLLVYAFLLYVVARFFVSKFLRVIAQTNSKELFSIAVLCICLGVAATAELSGLNLALGAFLAGLIISEGDFKNQAKSEILPLKDTFSAIFFASLGMLLNPSVFLDHWFLLIVAVLLVIGLKATVTFVVVFFFRYPVKTALMVAFGISQIGEFSFLILVTAFQSNIIDSNLYQLLLATALMSIVATPYLLKSAPWLARKIEFLEKLQYFSKEIAVKEKKKTDHVIVCGYGPTGVIVAKELQSTGVEVVFIDLNYSVIKSLKAKNHWAVYGDCSSQKVLDAAHIEGAVLLVLTIPDPISMQNSVLKVREAYPDLPILVRVKYESDKKKLTALGASEVVWEEYEAGHELTKRALSRLKLGEDAVRVHDTALLSE